MPCAGGYNNVVPGHGPAIVQPIAARRMLTLASASAAAPPAGLRRRRRDRVVAAPSSVPRPGRLPPIQMHRPRRSTSSATFARSWPQHCYAVPRPASGRKGACGSTPATARVGRRRLGPKGDRAWRSQGQPPGAGRSTARDAELKMPPEGEGKPLARRASRADHALGQRRGHLAARGRPAGRRTRTIGPGTSRARRRCRAVTRADWPRHPIDYFVLDAAGKGEACARARGRPLYARPPRLSRPDRPASHARARSTRSSTTRARRPTSGWSIGPWPIRPTASAGPACGSTWLAMPTRKAMAPIRCGRSGAIAIG